MQESKIDKDISNSKWKVVDWDEKKRKIFSKSYYNAHQVS